MDRTKALDSSNFIVETTATSCKGCGLCSKRCPMEALEMRTYSEADPGLNKKARVPDLNTDHCIGCGVCVFKCPTKSLILTPRPTENHPPQNGLEWVKDFWKARENE